MPNLLKLEVTPNVHIPAFVKPEDYGVKASRLKRQTAGEMAKRTPPAKDNFCWKKKGLTLDTGYYSERIPRKPFGLWESYANYPPASVIDSVVTERSRLLQEARLIEKKECLSSPGCSLLQRGYCQYLHCTPQTILPDHCYHA